MENRMDSFEKKATTLEDEVNKLKKYFYIEIEKKWAKNRKNFKQFKLAPRKDRDTVQTVSTQDTEFEIQDLKKTIADFAWEFPNYKTNSGIRSLKLKFWNRGGEEHVRKICSARQKRKIK